MKNLGYIYLHRRLKEKAFYKKPEYVLLWIHLLLSANHKESEIIWDNQVIKLKAGQLITGRKSLSEQTGVNEYKVERILKFFKSAQQIAQQTFPKFRIITIQKWENYQCNGSKVHNKVHNRCTTDAQQMHTNNNDNNDNNKKNEICLLLKNWNERQSSPIRAFEPLNIVNKHGVEKVDKLLKSCGQKNGGFSLFLKELKK